MATDRSRCASSLDLFGWLSSVLLFALLSGALVQLQDNPQPLSVSDYERV